MNSYQKKAIFFLILIFAVLSVTAILTNSFDALAKIRVEFFAMAAGFFLLSILLWVISWAYLIKNNNKIRYFDLVLVGFSAVLGSLTPIQVGAEALRSIKAKQYFKVSYTESLSASMIVKGFKFLLLAFFGSVLLFLYLINTIDSSFNPYAFVGLVSGFFVVVLASLLFLLPIHKETGLKIASFFKKLSVKWKKFGKVAEFFENYSANLSATNYFSLIVVFFLSLFSWIFEFLALYYSFLSFGIQMPVQSSLVLLILVSVIERTPFLPRGIGLVELVSYNFLAFPEFSKTVALTIPSIGGVLIVFGVVRLVIPTLVSIAFNVLLKVLLKKQVE